MREGNLIIKREEGRSGDIFFVSVQLDTIGVGEMGSRGGGGERGHPSPREMMIEAVSEQTGK